MKKSIIHFILLLISIGLHSQSMPDVYLGEYGIEYHSSIEGYQQYVGEKVMYVASSDKRHDRFFLDEGGKYNTHYIINSIKGSNKKFTITLKECGGESIIKLHVTNGWSRNLEYSQKNYYWVSSNGFEMDFYHTLPLVFIDEFEQLKSTLEGRIYSSDPQQYHRFVLEDVFFTHSPYPNSNNERIEIGLRFVNPNTENILEYKLEDLAEVEERLMEVGRVISQLPFISTYTIIDILQNPYSKKYYFPKDGVIAVIENSIDRKTKNKSISLVDRDAFDGDDTGHYNVSLISVDKPANSKIRYGQSAVIEEEGICKYTYIDNYINILLFADSEKINFLLKNLTQYSIKVVWDEGVFVDVDGTTSRIIHKGVENSQKDESQPSSVIIKGSYLADFAAPINKISYSSYLDGWYKTSLCGSVSKKKKETIKLMLPIQIQDIINEYIFTFEVTWEYDHPEYFN